jgi:two-component system, OmpR family, copper resistance phosphate regulon response regulator CusR
MRILLVEDEQTIANFIREGLEEECFAIDVVNNGKAGKEMIEDKLGSYDVILLDWMLPGLSGIELCRYIRTLNKDVPVIFLTAKDTVDDMVFGLETGANDYIRKPFSFEELLARIRVHLHRKTGESSVLKHGEIELDSELHRVTKKGQAVELTQKEFALLEFLLRN